jgi:hypothetical protein
MPGMSWVEFAMAISAPVLPAEIAKLARLTASMASHIQLFQRPWRAPGSVCVHRSRNVGMGEPGGGLQRRTGREQRLDDRTVAKQEKFDVRVAPLRQLRAGDDHGGPMVPSHGV